MLILCCYTELREQTYEWVKSVCPPNTPRFIWVADDPYAYGEVLADVWSCGEDFLVVEHDVVPPADAAVELARCDHGYCAYPYAWYTTVGPALGCTRFRGDFTRRFPAAMRETLESRVTFRQLDHVLMRRILRDKYGQQPHCHLPAATHLNEEKQLRPDADPTPVLRVEGFS